MQYYYVVLNEHTLGYIFTNSWGEKSLGILHTSILRGSYHNGMSGPLWISPMDKIRKATEKDFDQYRCVLPPDFYEIQAQAN